MFGKQCENLVALKLMLRPGSEKSKTGGEQAKCITCSLSHYRVHRWTGDVSEAVTAPLLLDTDMSGSDLCQAGAEQGAFVGS